MTPESSEKLLPRHHLHITSPKGVCTPRVHWKAQFPPWRLGEFVYRRRKTKWAELFPAGSVAINRLAEKMGRKNISLCRSALSKVDRDDAEKSRPLVAQIGVIDKYLSWHPADRHPATLWLAL